MKEKTVDEIMSENATDKVMLSYINDMAEHNISKIELLNKLKMIFNETSKVNDANTSDEECTLHCVSECYAVRDWMTANVFDFPDINGAREKYNKLLDKDNECDIQLIKIIEQYNNVD